MKTFIFKVIFGIFSFFPIMVNAQMDTTIVQKYNEPNCYINFGLGLGTSSGILAGFGLNYILPINWGISFSSNYYYKEAANLPDNYHASDMDFFPEFDITHSYSIRLIKEFQLKSKLYRLGFECGPSYIIYSEAHFTPNPNWNTPMFKGSNYNKSYKDSKIYGLSLRAKFGNLFKPAYGCEFALVSNINKYQSYIGFELHILLGKVREKIYIQSK